MKLFLKSLSHGHQTKSSKKSLYISLLLKTVLGGNKSSRILHGIGVTFLLSVSKQSERQTTTSELLFSISVTIVSNMAGTKQSSLSKNDK